MARTGGQAPLVAPGERPPPPLRERLRHCAGQVLTLSGYSGSRALRGIATRWAIMRFVIRYWRGREAALWAGGALISLLWALWELRELALDEPGTRHWLGLGLALFGIAVTLWKFFSRILRIHGVEGFEHLRGARSKLSLRPFQQEPAGSVRVALDALVPPEPPAPPGACVPVIEKVSADPHRTEAASKATNGFIFDPALSAALLDHPLRIEPGLGGTLTPDLRRKIMRDAGAQHLKAQAAALRILRAETLEKGRSLFDADKISLRELVIEGAEAPRCRIGKTSYLISCLTNDLAAQTIMSDDRRESQAPMDLYVNACDSTDAAGGAGLALKPFHFTPHLSNHVGAAVLAVSRDGHAVLCRQSGAARINADALVVSGAGSVDFEDLHHSGALEQRDLGLAIRYGMARELLEETGGITQESLMPSDRAYLRAYAGRVQLAGMYRDLRRGGQPIFVGFCRMLSDHVSIGTREAPQICPWSSPSETRLVPLPAGAAKRVINTADDMIAVIDALMADPGNNYRPSDQLLILRRLLQFEPMQRHFERALAQS